MAPIIILRQDSKCWSVQLLKRKQAETLRRPPLFRLGSLDQSVNQNEKKTAKLSASKMFASVPTQLALALTNLA